MNRKVIVILLMLVVAITGVFGGGKSEAKKPDRITVVYHPTIGGSTAIAVAKELGYFADEDLDVHLQMYTSGPPEIAAMVAGQVDVGFIGSGAAWLAFSGDVDIVSLDNIALTEEIITRKDRGINSIKDLKGKTIAVQDGAAGFTLLLVALEEAGMTLNDVKILNLANDNIPSTFNEKSIDAWAGWKPATTSLSNALGDNALVLATNATYPEKAFPSTWVANKDFVKNQGDVLLRFLRALNKAQIFRAENPVVACGYASTYAQQATNDLTAQLDDVIFPDEAMFREMYTTDSFAKMLDNLRSIQAARLKRSDLTVADILSDQFVRDIYK